MGARVVIYRTWRAEWKLLALFVVSSLVSPLLSGRLPWSIIQGELLSFGERSVILSLPLFWLLPFGLALMLLYRIYDYRYAVDRRGIESRVGILGLNQRIVRIRYEDVRSIEIDQTLVERFLGIGNLSIGTAATSVVEVYLEGIAAPAEVQEMVQAERDRRRMLNAEAEEEKRAQNLD